MNIRNQTYFFQIFETVSLMGIARINGIFSCKKGGKIECCMLGYRKACCCTFDSYSSLKQIIRPQEWLCHSRLRMVQSLQITGMKQNVLFLQRASMRKLINGSMRNDAPFLKERGTDEVGG